MTLYSIWLRIKDVLRNPLTIMTIVAIAAYVVMQMVFSLDCGLSIGRKMTGLGWLGEAFLLSMPFWLLNGRWRLTGVCVCWFVGIMLLVQAISYRYNDMPLTLSAMLDVRSYNGLVWTSSMALLKWRDVLFLLLPAAVTFSEKKLHISGVAAWQRWQKWVLAGAILIYWTLVPALFIMLNFQGFERQTNPYGAKPLIDYVPRFLPGEPWCDYTLIGFTRYSLSNIFNIKSVETIELSEADKARIRKYMAMAPKSDPGLRAAFAANRDKNLILIIVESLNHWTVDTVIDGHRLMPELHALMQQSGNISTNDIMTQIQSGGSSDGQLMYNTGLLPPEGCIVAFDYAGYNTFIPLAQALGFRDAREVIYEGPSVWNHKNTSRAYRYNALVSCEEDNLDARNCEEGGAMTQDAIVFCRGLEEIGAMKCPFMLELTSITMHQPFSDPCAPPVGWIQNLDPQDCSDYMKRYLTMTAAFDTALGDFVRSLKAKGLYDNSVIVIVADHSMKIDDSVKWVKQIPMVVLNAGVSRRLEGPRLQADVFPTILEIMGRLDESPWRGIGNSMFTPLSAIPASRLNDARTISDLIIRGDYFAK